MGERDGDDVRVQDFSPGGFPESEPDAGAANAAADAIGGADAGDGAGAPDATGAGPTRRGPGRPRSSTKKASARSKARSAEPVRLRVDQGARPPKGSGVPPQIAAGAAGDVQAATTSAALMIQMCEGMLAGAIGPHAALTPVERAMIVPPAGRMLARADAEKLAKYASVMDPMMLGVGLCIWGARVWTVSREQRKPEDRAASVGDAGAAAAPAPPVPETAAPARVNDDQAHRNGVAPAPFVLAAHVESDREVGGGF